MFKKVSVGILVAALSMSPALAQHHGGGGWGGGHGGGWGHGGGGYHGGGHGWHGGHRGWGGPAIGLGLGALGAYGAYEYTRPRCPYGYFMADNGACYPE